MWWLALVLLHVPADVSKLAVPVAEAAPDYSTSTLRAFAVSVAQGQHLNVAHFVDVVYCESRFDYQAIGDSGTSYGIAQIHLPAHPDISKKQALDPYWSLTWMANEWSQDRANEWSCWLLYNKNGWPATDFDLTG